MRRSALPLLALTLAVASSCARGPDTAPAPTAAIPPTPAAAAAWSAGAEDGLFWFYSRAEDGPKLAYGAPNSDAVRLMIYCRPTEPRVRLEATTPAATAPARLTVTSTGATAALPAASDANPMGGGRLVSAQAATTAPVLTAFRNTGRLTVAAGGEPMTMNAGPAERAAVQSFFAACA